jgi:hypothetical protein
MMQRFDEDESSFKPDPTTTISTEDPTTPPRLETEPDAPLRFGQEESPRAIVAQVLAQQEGKEYTPSPDAATVPDADRFDEVMKASETGQPGGASTSAQPAPAQTAPPPEESPEAELARLRKEKPKDRNGRLVSALLNLLDQAGAGANQVLASGHPVDEYGLANIAGRMIGGAGRGALDPAIDERAKSRRRMLELNQQIKQKLEVQKLQAQTARIAQPHAASGLTPAQLSSQRRAYSNFLGKFFPQGYKRGTRADVDSELNRLEMEPPPALPRKGGSGFNPQRVKTVGSDVVYVDSVDGDPVVVKIYSASGMTEAEKRRQAIDIARLNQARSRDGQPPLEFPEEVYSQDGAPASAIQPRAASPAPGAAPQPAPSVATEPIQAAPAPSAASPVTPPAATPPQESIPAARVRPREPKLAPSGAPPEPVTNTRVRPRGGGGRFRRGSASSGGSSRTDDIQESQAARYRSDVAFNAAKAAEARARGEDEVAQSYNNAAKVAQGNLDNLEKRRGARGGRAARAAAPSQPASPTAPTDPFGIFGNNQ